MATTIERLGIVETKVENLNEKMDDLKVDVKDMQQTIQTQLSEMYDASCTQHAELAKKISSLEKTKEKWTWIIAGIIGAGGFFAGHADKLLQLFT